ncbi:MAG: D-2-hydroxyacid dehydrogenase family protein [Steroidobacteraceae bacterium]
MRVAILDDWQQVAAGCADWNLLQGRAELVFFSQHIGSENALASALEGFDIICPMRERTWFPSSLLRRLPQLRMLALTGMGVRHVDISTCLEQRILCCGSGSYSAAQTAELALALMLAGARDLVAGDAAIRAGRFQEGTSLGYALEGRTLGLIGVGKIGARVAGYARALGMRVLAWSPNLDQARATAAGAEFASKEQLFRESDVISLHLVLSATTRGVVGAAELALMKSGALLVNTARGGLVDEAALLVALRAGRLTAALDVYDQEPLPPDHPLRSAPHTVLTPHLGFSTVATFGSFYSQSLENILSYLDGSPLRVLNPDVLPLLNLGTSSATT